MRQLRKKLEDNPDQPQFLITEPGVGYRFLADE
jgi:two-component system KDP operon response regulator KdpE